MEFPMDTSINQNGHFRRIESLYFYIYEMINEVNVGILQTATIVFIGIVWFI